MTNRVEHHLDNCRLLSLNRAAQFRQTFLVLFGLADRDHFPLLFRLLFSWKVAKMRGSVFEMPDFVSPFQKKISRRVVMKSLAGAALVMGGIGCVPFGSSSPPLGKLLVTYHGHPWYRGGRIWAIAWSPDSTRIASSAGRDIQIWTAADGSHILTYHKPGAIAWSPDGKRIVSVSGPTVPIWDAMTGKNVLVCQVRSEDVQHDVAVVTTVGWSPDGKRIVSGGFFEHTIRFNGGIDTTFYDQMQIWDATTGKVILRTPTDSTFGVLWSPDSTKIAAMGSAMEVLDASTGGHIASRAFAELYNRVAWSPDSRYIASAGRNNALDIWDATSGNTVSTFSTLDEVWSLAWSPDGKHIAIAYGLISKNGKEVQILDAQTGKPTYTYHSQLFVSILAWSPDGTRIASGGVDDNNRILAVEVWQAS